MIEEKKKKKKKEKKHFTLQFHPYRLYAGGVETKASPIYLFIFLLKREVLLNYKGDVRLVLILGQ